MEILEYFLKEYGESIGKKTDITTLPKKTDAGNPDFRIQDGKSKITGYIEEKHLNIKSLDFIENSEQIQRYIETFQILSWLINKRSYILMKNNFSIV